LMGMLSLTMAPHWDSNLSLIFLEHKAGQALTPPWYDTSHHRRLVVYDLSCTF
jgi:hypothetical protein